MEQAALRESGAQLADQAIGIGGLGRAYRIPVPFARIAAIFRNEGRLAARGQAHVLRLQVGVDLRAQRHDSIPAAIGKRLGDPHRFGDAADTHFEIEIDFGRFGHAGDRRGGAIMWRGAERDMPFACEHAAGCVQRDPARPRYIGFRPGMKIDDILRDALWPFQRFDIGDKLDRIARHEARCEAQPSQQLHQQPGGIAAGANADVQRLFGRLHARFHADDIAHPTLEAAVHFDQEIDGAALIAVIFGDQRIEQRPLLLDIEIGGEVGLQLFVISEGISLRIRLHEEIERVDDVEIGEQVDLDREMVDRIGKDDSRQPVAMRILLPVEKMARRFDLQRIIGHLGPAMGRRTQADDLRSQLDRAIIAIGGEVMERGFEHGAIKRHPLLQCNSQSFWEARFSARPLVLSRPRT